MKIIVQVDAANDLALLKAVGRFAPLSIAASRTVELGGTLATVGFPDTELQGFAPLRLIGINRRWSATRISWVVDTLAENLGLDNSVGLPKAVIVLPRGRA